MTPTRALRVLGLDAHAKPSDIKAAYRALAMQHHPDRGGNVFAFQEIQKAYDRLNDICRDCGGTGTVRVRTGAVVKETTCKTCWSTIT